MSLRILNSENLKIENKLSRFDRYFESPCVRRDTEQFCIVSLSQEASDTVEMYE